MGRTSTFTQEIADEICERLSKGEPLAQICRDEHMPAARTISDWKEAHEEFGTEFGRARDDGFDAIALQALDIADETAKDAHKGKAGEAIPNNEWIARSRLRVETRLKLLAKWDPRRYGDKQLLGSDPDNPLPSGFTVTLVKRAATE